MVRQAICKTALLEFLDRLSGAETPVIAVPLNSLLPRGKGNATHSMVGFNADFGCIPLAYLLVDRRRSRARI
jgi:hypothetical protein